MGRGNAGAFGELFDATSTYVYGLALSILKSPQLATAATEEVYAEVWRTAPQFDPRGSSVLAWLMSMAHRHFAERFRPRSDGSTPARDGVLAAGPVDPAGNGGPSGLEGERARRAIDSLEEEDRQAVTLAYFGGYSDTEIAQVLGLPVGTVKTRLRNGLLRLRQALGGSG